MNDDTSSSLPDMLNGRLDDPLWRLHHLYWIENKTGHLQRFRPNAAQLRLHHNLWFRNAVLKARQLGISTYVAMLMLDRCLFTPHFHAGIIDKTLPDAEQKLEKVRFAWEHLDYLPPHPTPEDRALAYLGALLKQRSGMQKKSEWHPVADARTRLAFANGSDIRLGTTLRGGTLQLLHVSELAHVSVHAPWRAREIRTGAINTVPAEGTIILESTHEGGRYGVNYEMTVRAMENAAAAELSPLDFRFFFFSWADNPDYALKGKGGWPDSMAAYYEKLATEHGVHLSHAQKLWYAHMERTMGAAMRQEYPSTPDEAFATGNDGAIYGAQIARLREHGRIGVEQGLNPHEPRRRRGPAGPRARGAGTAGAYRVGFGHERPHRHLAGAALWRQHLLAQPLCRQSIAAGAFCRKNSRVAAPLWPHCHPFFAARCRPPRPPRPLLCGELGAVRHCLGTRGAPHAGYLAWH